MVSIRIELVTITYSATFKRQLKRLARKYRRIRSDIEPMLRQLADGKVVGKQITGSVHPLYKVRVPNSDARRGSSGGYRVIYFLVAESDTLLLTIYSKSDQSDISPDEIRIILRNEGFSS